MRKILALVLSCALILIVLYPNVYLGILQIGNEINGIDSLVDGADDSVALVGEKLKGSGQTPESWVLENIEWVSDYDLYFNLEYWARPGETIMAGKGDCEDRAILTKSLNEYLQHETELVVQLDHVYLVKDGENYFGVSGTTSVTELVKNVIYGIPFIRKLVIISGLIMIWGACIIIGRRSQKNLPRRYPLN
ncbi:MAG: hypothetical protein JW825_00115 [Candidatus Methanofastidiosa archaeon]|nr:hypothetical protein [Candidatus Methanofastidiosa archaeon]